MSKYHAQRTTLDGITFASKAEARRYQDLKILELSGEIDNLVLQPVFPLVVNDVKIGKYIADFSYYEGDNKIVEDVKGIKTPVYRLKKKLVEALYKIEITET
jgi:hypothetical protein